MMATTYETPELTELGILNVETLSNSGGGNKKKKAPRQTLLNGGGGPKKDMHENPCKEERYLDQDICWIDDTVK